jgi:hypothetical protein
MCKFARANRHLPSLSRRQQQQCKTSARAHTKNLRPSIYAHTQSANFYGLFERWRRLRARARELANVSGPCKKNNVAGTLSQR